jgi:hypothetical protein
MYEPASRDILCGSCRLVGRGNYLSRFNGKLQMLGFIEVELSTDSSIELPFGI